MRRIVLCVVAMGVNQAAWAAPNPVPPPAVKDPKALQAEATRFAQQLHMVVDRVATGYVRPIPREDLLEAALGGLFQAAGRPAPRDLRAQVRQAIALAEALRAEASAGNGAAADGKPNAKFMLASSRRRVDPVERLLERLRTEVGDAPALVGTDSVVVACRALARKLDPYSGVVTADEQRRASQMDYDGVGVGLELRPQLTPGPFEVETVHPGGPAQRAGLRPGDVITHLDGEAAAKAAPALVLALRSGQPADGVAPLARPGGPEQAPVQVPDQVRVTYRRPGEKADRSALLHRGRRRPETVLGVRRNDDNGWDYVIDDRAGVAHVRVAGLSRGTSEELRQVLGDLRDRKVKGLILDLRWCPGGYLNEAVEAADLFLGEAVVATVRSRGQQEDTVYRSTSEGKFRGFTVAVLVNAETSGGAELIAAALQDHRRGVVVGQRTLGKASVQTPISLGVEGTGFKLTSGTFVRPSGKNLHRFADDGTAAVWGVLPDEDARLSPDLGRRLRQWWQAQSLRPGGSAERLPLDDPRADPQQQAALAVLRKRLR